jgi:hypothetical protein
LRINTWYLLAQGATQLGIDLTCLFRVLEISKEADRPKWATAQFDSEIEPLYIKVIYVLNLSSGKSPGQLVEFVPEGIQRQQTDDSVDDFAAVK